MENQIFQIKNEIFKCQNMIKNQTNESIFYKIMFQGIGIESKFVNAKSEILNKIKLSTLSSSNPYVILL